MITALIRTHPGREFTTEIAVRSAALESCHVILFNGEKVEDFSYNLYCNDLKDRVTDGWFFFLDSDDTVIPGAIDRLRPHLTGTTPVICQMLRAGKPKPSIKGIARGKIGLPCLILHHSHKSVADVTARECGDYDWIKAVTDKLGYKWVPIPLVDSPKRSYGK